MESFVEASFKVILLEAFMEHFAASIASMGASMEAVKACTEAFMSFH